MNGGQIDNDNEIGDFGNIYPDSKPYSIKSFYISVITHQVAVRNAVKSL